MADAEENRFRERIQANPADESLRLMFADWLDERGDPLGEFIRIQCALSDLPVDDPRRGYLEAREQALREEHEMSWLGTLRPILSGWEFRRGMLEVVSMETTEFLAHGEELLALAPIRRVRFLDDGKQFPRLMECPSLSKLVEIDLCNNALGNGGPNLLARCPYLGQLELLDLGFNGLSDRGLETLAGIASLRRLHTLHINDNPLIGSPGIRALADSPHLANVRTLDISGNSLGGSALRLLINSETMTLLDNLHLAGNNIGDDGVEALARSALLTRMLQRSPILHLEQNRIGPMGARGLAESPRVEPLEFLGLDGNAIGDAGLVSLAQSPNLRSLRVLNLRDNRIGDAGVLALAQSLLPQTLTQLDLTGNFVTAEMVRAVDEAAIAYDWRKKIDIRVDAGLHQRVARR